MRNTTQTVDAKMTTATTQNRGVAPNTKADWHTLENTWRYFVGTDSKGRTIELHQLTGNGGQLVQVTDGKKAYLKAANGDNNATYASVLDYAHKTFVGTTEWFR